MQKNTVEMNRLKKKLENQLEQEFQREEKLEQEFQRQMFLVRVRFGLVILVLLLTTTYLLYIK